MSPERCRRRRRSDGRGGGGSGGGSSSGGSGSSGRGGGGGGGGSGGGGGAGAGSAAAAAAAASPGSPNFGAIYKLFAGLFDPQRPFDAGAAVEGVGVLSALDKEIVKLLVKNLEVNLGNVGVCRRLLQNYMASVNAPVGR